MIVFAAVIPNSPVLVKHGSVIPEQTFDAIARIQEMLDRTVPDTIFVISEHAQSFDSVFTLPFATKFTESLKRLGFISEHISYPADSELLGRIQMHARTHNLPLRSIHSESLDTGSGIALRLLRAAQKKCSVITIGTSARTIEEHIAFGYELKNIVHTSKKRVAVIITGNAGPREFARGIIASLIDRSPSQLASIAANKSLAGAETLAKPLAIGYGLLRGFPPQTKLMSDETTEHTQLVSAVLFSE